MLRYFYETSKARQLREDIANGAASWDDYETEADHFQAVQDRAAEDVAARQMDRTL